MNVEYIYIYRVREREHTVRRCSFVFVVFRLAS